MAKKKQVSNPCRSEVTLLSCLSAILVGFSAATITTPVDIALLDGLNGFRIEGVAAGDQLGNSLSAVGDINNDGFQDFAVAARLADNGSPETGSIYILFGRSTGFPARFDLASLDGTNGFRIDGVSQNHQLRFICGLKDMNGDGISDFAVSPHNLNTVYVIFGVASFPPVFDLVSLDGVNGFLIHGEVAGDGLGSALASGDVNGDGVSDLIVSADRADSNTGKVYVLYGRSVQASFEGTLKLSDVVFEQGAGVRINGVTAGDRCGFSVSAGDVNGDGLDDILIGAQDANTKRGTAYLVSGHALIQPHVSTFFLASSLNSSTGVKIDGLQTYDRLGVSVSCGDVNGDGLDDVVIGAPFTEVGGLNNVGSVYVIFGSASFPSVPTLTALDGIIGFRVDGAQDKGRFGAALSTGDVNADGFDELVIGTTTTDFGGTNTGSVVVIFGKGGSSGPTLQISALAEGEGFRMDGPSEKDNLGGNVGVGDCNGDGVGDLLLGATGVDGADGDGTGGVFVVFGAATSGTSTPTPTATTSSAPITTTSSTTTAAATSTSSTTTASVTTTSSTPPPTSTSIAKSSTPKTVETPPPTTSTPLVNYTWPAVYDSSNLVGSLGFQIGGAVDYDELGYSVGIVGDLNGDGVDDLVVTAAAIDAAKVFVVFGASFFATDIDLTTLDGTNGFLVRFPGYTPAFDSNARTADAAGDVNGDGIGDLILGAPCSNPSNPSFSSPQDCFGVAFVVFGSRAGFPAVLELGSLDGTTGFRVVADPVLKRRRFIDLPDLPSYDEPELGYAVTSAGDLNDDGFNDIAVGAPFMDGSGTDRGSAYVIFGKSSFPPTIKVNTMQTETGFAMSGSGNGNKLGIALASTDFNGDGIDDLVLGAQGKIYVVFGTKEGIPLSLNMNSLDGSNGVQIDGDGGAFGLAVSSAGDFNGDGIGDIVVGAAQGDGRTYVIFGNTTSPVRTPLSVVDLEGSNGFWLAGKTGSSLGAAVSAGDLNGDCLDDIVVGANDQVYVIFGSTTPLPALLDLEAWPLGGVEGFRVEGATGGRLGFSIGSRGDLNGDGAQDMVMGAPREPGRLADIYRGGKAYVLFGVKTACCAGRTPDLEAGVCVCAAGFAEGVHDACSPCDVGTYKPLSGSESCIACPDEMVSLQAGQSSCEACPAGTYPNDNQTACLPCASQAPNANSSVPAGCLGIGLCPAGQTGLDRDDAPCVQCEPGTFKDAPGSAACVACTEGAFSNYGASTCHVGAQLLESTAVSHAAGDLCLPLELAGAGDVNRGGDSLFRFNLTVQRDGRNDTVVRLMLWQEGLEAPLQPAAFLEAAASNAPAESAAPSEKRCGEGNLVLLLVTHSLAVVGGGFIGGVAVWCFVGAPGGPARFDAAAADKRQVAGDLALDMRSAPLDSRNGLGALPGSYTSGKELSQPVFSV